MYNIQMPEQGLKMELHGNKLLILKKIKKFSTWVLTVLKERTIIQLEIRKEKKPSFSYNIASSTMLI